MTNFERFLRKVIRENVEKARAEGIEIGRKQEIEIGKRQGILQVAKEMAKYKVPDEDIIKVTCLSKEELQDLKKQELGYKGI